jgi:predicted transcriptional regulator/transcriptional regulator with XRE-family HTH domain
MRKIFMGVRLRVLREQRQLTQAQLAQQLEISASYLNQIENNERPLTAQVLLRLQTRLGVDPQFFSEDDDARMLAQLRDALVDDAAEIPLAELQSMVQQTPMLAEALVRLQRRCRNAEERLAALATVGDERQPMLRHWLQPHEEVRDFFYARHNYIDRLDNYAENLHEKLMSMALSSNKKAKSSEKRDREFHGGDLVPKLIAHLREKHGVQVRRETVANSAGIRRFDIDTRILSIAGAIEVGQFAFQLAIQIAHLEFGDALDTIVREGEFNNDTARALTRIGLASYFAGALVLPYRIFLRAAEELRYDVELLADRFGVSFETICHRLSTLQKPEARGVPFFFIRVDRAGNISKRQSATDFHFSRTGGTCPLWAVYEAFAQPGKILTQLARMPDGRIYLWIARSITHRRGGYGTPARTFALGLGCDLRHAERLIYAKGLNLNDPDAATPIGAGCKVCDRIDCDQRAFPALGRDLDIDPNRRQWQPYAIEIGVS